MTAIISMFYPGGDTFYHVKAALNQGRHSGQCVCIARTGLNPNTNILFAVK